MRYFRIGVKILLLQFGVCQIFKCVRNALQWNLSKADTLEANIFVRFSHVSALDRLWLWDFD